MKWLPAWWQGQTGPALLAATRGTVCCLRLMGRFKVASHKHVRCPDPRGEEQRGDRRKVADGAAQTGAHGGADESASCRCAFLNGRHISAFRKPPCGFGLWTWYFTAFPSRLTVHAPVCLHAQWSLLRTLYLPCLRGRCGGLVTSTPPRAAFLASSQSDCPRPGSVHHPIGTFLKEVSSPRPHLSSVQFSKHL